MHLFQLSSISDGDRGIGDNRNTCNCDGTPSCHLQRHEVVPLTIPKGSANGPGYFYAQTNLHVHCRIIDAADHQATHMYKLIARFL